MNLTKSPKPEENESKTPTTITKDINYYYIEPPEPVACSPVPGSDEAPEQELLSPPQFKDVDVDDEKQVKEYIDFFYEFHRLCEEGRVQSNDKPLERGLFPGNIKITFN